jgi:sugar phosphate isomerase/epimerase
MYKTKLCLAIGNFGIDAEAQIKLFQEVGFDGFFSDWDDNITKYRALADELGMIYQSIHAPFGKAAVLWTDSKEADEAVEELKRCIDDCAKVSVPILVMHTYIGFEPSDGPTEAGLVNYGKIVDHAAEKGIKIAFENTEGEEYLAALLEHFKDRENVGYCWDSGHEQCYSHSKDLLALYGDRLIATHLNDNLGVSRYDGQTYWTDDLHLLPFDGVIDWTDAADRLNKCGYDGYLTFELNTKSKSAKRENGKYEKMDIRDYLAEAYARACRVAFLKLRRK